MTAGPEPACRAPLSQVAALGLLAVLLVLAGWVGPVAAASAPDVGETHPVQILLEEVRPALARPGEDVVLVGTIVNLTTTPVAAGSVRASTAYQGLDTRRAVADWGSGALDVDTTRELGEDEVDAVLAPGARVRFQIRIPAQELDPPFDFATLPLSLTVGTASPEDAGRASAPTGTAGRLRSYLIWDGQTDIDHRPVELGVLVPLTLPGDPALASTNPEARAEAWRAAVGPESRAVTLLEALAGLPVTFAVDPALLSPLHPPATLAEEVADDDTEQPPATATADDGTPTSQGLTGTASPSPTDPGGDADAPPADVPIVGDPTVALRAALAEVPQDRLWWLPAGDIDTMALLDTGMPSADVAALLQRDLPGPPEHAGTELGAGLGEEEALPAAPTEVEPPEAEELLERGRHDVAWPVTSGLEAADLEALRDVWSTGAASGLAAVVVRGDVVASDGALTPSAARPHRDGTVVLGLDGRLSGIAASADRVEVAVATQRLLAEALAVYQERPATERTLLIGLPRTADTAPDVLATVLGTVDESPWLTVRPSRELLAAGSTGDPITLRPAQVADPPAGDRTAYPSPRPSPLTPERVAEVEQVHAQLVGAAEILPDPEDALEAWEEVLAQQYSARWREAPATWEEPLEAGREAAEEVLEGVHINPTTVNFLADEGLIQVTVVNALPVEVHNLRMSVVPRNARLQVVEPPEPLSIGPSSRATVQFRARAMAAGEVPLATSLATPAGVPVGATEVMTVRVQPTGVWIYWVFGGLAGIIVVLGVVRALRPRPTTETEESP